MDGRISHETQERLQHALERLQYEPRVGERRVEERRKASLILVPVEQERRFLPDRRIEDRRKNMTSEDRPQYTPRTRQRRVGERRQSSLVLVPIAQERRKLIERRNAERRGI